MFKLLGVFMLAAVQLGSPMVAANPVPTLERRFDTSNFFTSQVNLQNAANVFKKDSYNTFPADPPQLGVGHPAL